VKRVLLSGIIIGVLLAAAAGAEEVRGIIQGRIINGTEPHKVVTGQEVILYRAQGEKALPQITTKTDTQGNYLFKGLATDSDYKYQVSTIYLKAPYFTDLITFGSGKDKLQTIDLPVYELTDKPDQIRLQREHLVLDTTGNELLVTDIAIMENMGSKTFWGKDKTAGLRFSLPNGFSDFRGVGEIIKDPNNPDQSVYIYTDPVPPGTREVFFAYKLDFSGLRCSIAKGFFYHTPQLDLFLPDQGFQLNSTGLTFQGYQDMGQKRFLVWLGKDFKSGASLNIEITGSQPTSYRIYKGIGYGFVILLIIMGFGYPLVVSRFFGGATAIHDSPKDKEAIKGLRKEKRRLLELTAELDDRFDASQIPEEEYRGLRKKNMQALVKVAQVLKQYEEL